MNVPPEIAVGDGALGFWKAITKHWPSTKHQRYWVHKTANVLNKLPKSLQPKVKGSIHDIWMAETKENANNAVDLCVKQYKAKYSKAMERVSKDRDKLLVFYDFPAEATVTLVRENVSITKMRTTSWKTAWEKAGLPSGPNIRQGVHVLKHTCGRRLRAAGVSRETRKVCLGHTDGDITTHYL